MSATTDADPYAAVDQEAFRYQAEEVGPGRILDTLYGANMITMAIQRIKATYSLDAETVKMLERLARRWKTSKSDALRRAIRSAAAGSGARDDGPGGRVAALKRLQASLALTEGVVDAWTRHVRAERRASSPRQRKR